MSIVNVQEVIRRVFVTEKSYTLAEATNTYILEVAMWADKGQIQKAVERMFDVQVEDVRTLVQRGKSKRFGRSMGKRSNFKKAYVTLKKGQKIESGQPG